MFGNPETTPGGRALKFYASVRLDVRKVETLRNGTDVVGSHTRVKVVKNKVAPPFKEAEFDIMYGRAFHPKAALSISVLRITSLIRADPGLHITDQRSPRAEMQLSSFLLTILMLRMKSKKRSESLICLQKMTMQTLQQALLLKHPKTTLMMTIS